MFPVPGTLLLSHSQNLTPQPQQEEKLKAGRQKKMEEEDIPTIGEHERKKKKRKKIKTEEHEIQIEEEEQQHQVNLEESREEKKTKKKKKRKNETPKTKEDANQVEEDPGINFKVELGQEKPGKIAPFVAYFPSGFDLKKATNSEEDGVEVKAYRKKDRPNRLRLVVSPKGLNVDFVGASHSGEAAASQVCTYALGVLDKKAQTLKIIPIAANKILRMEPIVGVSTSHEKEVPKATNEEDSTPANKADKLRVLTNIYGTKRANREDKKKAKLNQAQDAKTQKVIDDKVGEVRVNKEALETTGGIPTRNIPPHDSTADTPEKAYPIDIIILNGEWDYLLDILELMQSGTEVNPDAYPSFVCNRIHKLWEIKDEEEKTKLACILSYITHLIKFNDQRSAHHGSFAKKHRIPAILNQKFFSMFVDTDKFNISIEKRDLLISYVLVLTLVADGYRTNISDIAKDLKMRSVDLRDHYQNLGCKLKREDKGFVMTLPVPLQFPKLKLKRRR